MTSMTSRLPIGSFDTVNAADGGLLELRNVSKHFGNQKVLKDISLQVAAGEFLTLLGESGSGKTTLLRIIAGFEHPRKCCLWPARYRNCITGNSRTSYRRVAHGEDAGVRRATTGKTQRRTAAEDRTGSCSREPATVIAAR